MKITVVVPTYGRPQDLLRCLSGLKNQLRYPDEVIVVVRDIDTQTWAALETFGSQDLPLKILTATLPGQVAALNLGIANSEGDIIAITDDDAIPRPEWLKRIEINFLKDDKVGGVGGRDWKFTEQRMLTENRKVVGKIQWYGEIIGDHNMGIGAPREVDVLKGANMSYRRTAISNLKFDEYLKGKGAQVGNDYAFSLSLKKAGWRLIYDPSVEVDHYLAERLDNGQRGKFESTAMIEHVHNNTLIILNALPPTRRTIFLLWAVFIGTRNRRGLIQCVRFLPREGFLSIKKLNASLHGRWQGWKTWKKCQQRTKYA